MSILNNFDSVIAPVLRGLAGSLNLRRRRLGDQIADVIAAGVRERTLAEQKEPDGNPLQANRGQYGKRKRRRGMKIGVGLYGDEEGGEMLEFEQVRGQVAMSDDSLVMTAGLDAEVQQKVDWFITGNPANNQPPRPYYELDDAILADVDDLCDEAILDTIHDLGGS